LLFEQDLAKKEGALFHSFRKGGKKTPTSKIEMALDSNAIVSPRHCDVYILAIERTCVKNAGA
jgi:hypothetical protein